jgi:hypothetical protein
MWSVSSFLETRRDSIHGDFVQNGMQRIDGDPSSSPTQSDMFKKLFRRWFMSKTLFYQWLMAWIFFPKKALEQSAWPVCPQNLS